MLRVDVLKGVLSSASPLELPVPIFLIVPDTILPLVAQKRSQLTKGLHWYRIGFLPTFMLFSPHLHTPCSNNSRDFLFPTLKVCPLSSGPHKSQTSKRTTVTTGAFGRKGRNGARTGHSALSDAHSCNETERQRKRSSNGNTLDCAQQHMTTPEVRQRQMVKRPDLRLRD